MQRIVLHSHSVTLAAPIQAEFSHLLKISSGANADKGLIHLLPNNMPSKVLLIPDC